MTTQVTRTVTGLLMFAMGALAQTTAPKGPAFEVAVIKPLDLRQAAAVPGFSMGMKVTGQQMTFRGPLEMAIELSYGVARGQIDGLELLANGNGGMYDISAMLPVGATEAQVPAMLQALLEERFKAVIRKTSKQATVYALLVGKDGIKFSKKDSTEPEQTSAVVINSAQRSAQIGGARVSQGANGTKIEATSPAGMLFALATLMQAPLVVDKTGLQGTYDIKVDVPLPGSIPGPVNADDIQRIRRNAVAEGLGKIGLKLEQQKSTVDAIVIERIANAPTEN